MNPQYPRYDRLRRARLCNRTMRAVFIVALGMGPFAGASAAQPTRLSVAAWRTDIAFAESTMRLVHPAPFHRVSRTQFDVAFRTLNREVPRLTDLEIAARLVGITSMLNDGHSRLAAGAPVFKRDVVFPIRIERFADGIHIIATRPADADIAGARVLRIGAMSATATWDSLESFSSGDNRFSRMSGVSFLLANPEILHVLGLTSARELPIVALTAGGDTVRRNITSVSEAVNAAWTSDGWNGPGGATTTVRKADSRDAFVTARRNRAYWFVERDGGLYVQINQVTDSRDSVDAGKSRAVLTLAQFSARIMERIDAGGIGRVILDLRFNDGGNNALVKPFVNGIAARPAINARGRFFVITGRETYSAAMNFVSMLEDRTEALFVGEPPGGSPLHYGDAAPFTLPNSKLTLRVSTLMWNTGVAANDVREIMEPDLPAPPTFRDFASGIDGPLRVIDAYREGDVLADAMRMRYRASGLDEALRIADSIRARAAASNRDDAWASEVQQLIEFSYSIIPIAKSRNDVFRAFTYVTEKYPSSHLAWYELGRVLAFVNEWKPARESFAKARALRPNNAVIQRAHEAALRR